MLAKKLEEVLNEQINAEIYSSYIYYAMSAYFESVNLRGFAQWMHVQAQEELVHADKFFRFICDRGGRVALKAVQAPKTEWASAIDAVSEAYKHEQYITGRIYNMVDMALQEKDFATKTFLDWFVTEQVEEEANADKILQDLKLVQQSSQGIFLLDREVGTRTFSMPAAAD